jgi:hypothetical protein
MRTKICAVPIFVESPMSEESDRMMVLLQELAVLKKGTGTRRTGPMTRKRRKEIGQEMKRLARQKKNAKQ